MSKILKNELEVYQQGFFKESIAGGCYNTFLFKTQGRWRWMESWFSEVCHRSKDRTQYHQSPFYVTAEEALLSFLWETQEQDKYNFIL